jgi:hypothetical protein
VLDIDRQRYQEGLNEHIEVLYFLLLASAKLDIFQRNIE